MSFPIGVDDMEVEEKDKGLGGGGGGDRLVGEMKVEGM